jgi:hypothetical protein
MDKGQRKRRAAVGAIALLEWRDRMAREEARDRMVRANAEREMTMRYERMIAEMRRQAEEFSHGAQPQRWRSVASEDTSPTNRASHYS